MQRIVERAWAWSLTPVFYEEECSRYDETPMQVTVQDVCIGSGGGMSGAASVSQRECFVRDVEETVAGVWKLSQTETTFVLLGKVGSADQAGVRYLGIISNPLSWVHSVRSCAPRVSPSVRWRG